MNSSPPKRATVSIGRNIDRRRSASPTSTRVAGLMPERVVDVLEVVDVEEQHADPRVRAPGAVERHPETVEEQGPVGEAGQRVVERHVGEADLEALALDRVAQRSADERGGQVALER